MEKLINLLNQYEAKRHKTSIVAEIRKQKEDRLSYLEMNWNYSELLCFSKGYEFIKWLVDNDKIWINKNSDRSAMIDLMRAEVKEWTDVFEWTEKYEWYIMILSIQDNPIEFLVSILK